MVRAIVSLLLFAMATDAFGSDSLEMRSQSIEKRSLHEVIAEVRESLRLESAAKSPAEQARAIHQLVKLCEDMRRDGRMTISPTWKRLRGTIVSRLRRIKRQLERDLDRGDRPNPESIDVIAGVVAAQVANVGRAMAPPAAFAPMVQIGVARDHGAELVRLIQRTISPNSWDQNGGRSTIVYYAPRQAIVVRAPGEIHGRAGRLLGDVRKAGDF